MLKPEEKKCDHKDKITVIEEQPYFDIGLSELCYTEPSYWCPICQQPVFSVDGVLMTQEEKTAHDKDLDSIPF